MRLRPHNWGALGGCNHPPHRFSHSLAWWVHSRSLLLLWPVCLTPIAWKCQGSVSSPYNTINPRNGQSCSALNTAPAKSHIQSLFQVQWGSHPERSPVPSFQVIYHKEIFDSSISTTNTKITLLCRVKDRGIKISKLMPFWGWIFITWQGCATQP